MDTDTQSHIYTERWRFEMFYWNLDVCLTLQALPPCEGGAPNIKSFEGKLQQLYHIPWAEKDSDR